MLKLTLLVSSVWFPTILIKSGVIRLPHIPTTRSTTTHRITSTPANQTDQTNTLIHSDHISTHCRNKRHYASKAEERKRWKIFRDNLHYIERLNANHTIQSYYNSNNIDSDSNTSNQTTAIFGITKFADCTDKELEQMAMKLPKQYHDDSVALAFAEEVGAPLPVDFDWRSRSVVTPVRDQDKCNSCWAFAAVAVIETFWAIKTGQMQDLSEQELIDCDINSDGCRYGYPATAYLVAERKGMLHESKLPYMDSRGPECPKQNGSVFVKSIQKIKSNAHAIADYVYNYGPVSVNFRVTMPFYHYTVGIFRPSPDECNRSNRYHVMTIVGFGQVADQPYWILKNSWGTNWGDEGYIRFAKGENACGIEDFPYSIQL
ncbi:unnamed protein product [Anisakis simplex]|uniref:Cathepsin F (inferred by orthology to a S. mansoni protein) n=1 Tax=Anisakis simplex TaxID=6269 RepID=A0A0M3J0R1_ANISI|nr:unnamed protein product [Anisakis simplex]